MSVSDDTISGIAAVLRRGPFIVFSLSFSDRIMIRAGGFAFKIQS